MEHSVSEGFANEGSPVNGAPRSHGVRLAVLSLLRSPWAAPIFTLPFLLMLAVHQLLGLSDALLVAENPGERAARGYNLLLGINMNICPLAAILHLLARSQRAFPWIAAKLLVTTIILLLGLLAL